jgi:DUF1365 family protein
MKSVVRHILIIVVLMGVMVFMKMDWCQVYVLPNRWVLPGNQVRTIMHSAIYQGNLRHRRFYPKRHEFSYKSTLFYIDLDELPQLFEGVCGWSLGRPNLGYFRRADYLGDAALSLIEEVKTECIKLLGYSPSGAVRMLTNLRIWGMCFNPVTFYYLFDVNSDKPNVVLAQVNNTPWDQRHIYALVCDPVTGKINSTFDKNFHVSPFNPIDMHYNWISTAPTEHLVVHMENHAVPSASAEVQCHMDATLTLDKQLWDKKHLQRLLWQQPWITLKIPVMIYWQALKLFLKGVPFYPYQKPDVDPSKSQAINLKKTGESL